MTTILDPARTTALDVGFETPELDVATGLLVDADFGTNAGMMATKRLRAIGFVVTGGALAERPPTDDPAAQVRALRSRIQKHRLSKQEIARAIRVDRRSLSGFAKGTIRPSRERLELLRTFAELCDAIDLDRPGTVREVLLARRSHLALIDQLPTAGRSILTTWRTLVTRAEATVTVQPRTTQPAPVWEAAARALLEGRLCTPPRARTVRPESTYETDPDDAAAFNEPEYRSGRRNRP